MKLIVAGANNPTFVVIKEQIVVVTVYREM